MAMVTDMAMAVTSRPQLLHKAPLLRLLSKKWLLRLSLIVGALALSYLSLIATIAEIGDEVDPDLVLRVQPANSLALAAKGDILWTLHPEEAKNPQILQLAQSALRSQALNARAIRLLAVAAQGNDQSDIADKLVGLSAKVSRRDAFSQLWLMQSAANRGDRNGELAHYDVALRTFGPMQDVLFPKLAKMLDDRDYHPAFKPYLHFDSPWLKEFLTFVIWNSDHYPALASTLLTAGGLPIKDEQYRNYETQLLGQLASKRNFELAKTYYLSLLGSNAASLRSVQLTSASTDQKFAPINWRLDSGEGVGVSTEMKNSILYLNASASAQSSGVVAQKLMYLPPGAYVFAQNYIAHKLDNGAAATWLVLCNYETDSKVLVQFKLNFEPDVRNGQVRFVVPLGCPHQIIELALNGGDAPEGADITVSHLGIAGTN